MSHYYSAFGGRVCSDVFLPELPSTDAGAADWTLHHTEQRPPQPRGQLLGASAKGGCEVALWRTYSGYRLRHTCVGEFDISRDGASITCWRDKNVSDVQVQNDVVGRILPLVFHVQGALCLHASAVVVDGNAIAFAADPRLGKSTLAYALVRAGALLGSDDVVVVQTHPRVVMRRGVEHLRLRADVTERLACEEVSRRSALDGKDVVQFSEVSRVAEREVPLAAIYLLAPFAARRRQDSVSRMRVQERAATMLLVRHARMGRVLCGTDGGEMLVRAAAVTRQVPVYALHVERDLARINQVAEHLLQWHGSRLALATGTNG